MSTEQTKNELRETQIRLLNALDVVCKKHNITYWLDFGTLLGAVRHKTFIPWDDDIDISMPMADYKKFLSLAQAELPDDIFVQTPETDKKYTQGFAKLRDCYSMFITSPTEPTSHYGIYLDIFPYIEYPAMPKLAKKLLLYATGRSRAYAYMDKKYVLMNKLIYFASKLVWFLLTPFKNKTYGQTHEDNWYYYSYKHDDLYPIGKIEFNNKEYPAPHNPDACLTEMYGDYMTPPSKDVQAQQIHAMAILPNIPCNHPTAKQKIHEN